MPHPIRAEHVLVVDDDPLVLDVLEFLLEEHWRVLRAGSAAQALGLPGRELDTLVLAAQLHDIGKIGVDDHYLDKRGDLEPDERRGVQRH